MQSGRGPPEPQNATIGSHIILSARWIPDTALAIKSTSQYGPNFTRKSTLTRVYYESDDICRDDNCNEGGRPIVDYEGSQGDEDTNLQNRST